MKQKFGAFALFAYLVLIGILFFICLTVPMHAQTSNTFNVYQFRNQAADGTVGTMVTLAQSQCSQTTGYTCVIVFDPILNEFPSGTMPARCASCFWADYRNGSGWAAGNSVSDSVLYVSQSGSDANDGLSWGHAKGTIASAVAALPSCTPKPSANNVTQAFSGKCGTVMLGANGASSSAGYVVSSLIINSVMVRIVGVDELSTQVRVSGTLGIEFNGANVNGSQFSPNPVMGASGGLENLTLIGDGTANQICLLDLDASGITHKNVRIAGCNGTGAIGHEIANDANGISERHREDKVSYDDNTTHILLTASNGAGLGSLAHLSLINDHITLNNNQTGLSASGFAQVGCELCSGVINTTLPATNTNTEIKIQNSAQIKGSWGFVTDNGAVSSLTMCSGCTSSNFQVYGWDPYPTSTVYQLSTQDDPFYVITTAANLNNGVCFLDSTLTVRQCIGLDGSNFLAIGNPATEQFSVSNVQGGGIWMPGSTSGSANLKAPATGGVGSTLPTIAGSLAVSGNSGSSLIQAKKGTAGCTTAASIGGLCATAITVSWATAFVDTNYSVTCGPSGAPTNIPGTPFVSAKATGSVTVNYFAITATAAAWATVDCIAQHD